MYRTPQTCAGFSLLELAIALVILTLLGSTMLPLVSSQRDLLARQEARKQLDEARETLLAFAMVNGRLPCPARADLSSGQANAGREDCSLSHGVLPWSSLGLRESDPWGLRFSYYAQPAFSAPLAAGTLCSFSLDTLGNANIKDRSGAGYDIASALPAVIVSHGSRSFGAYRSDGHQEAGALGDEAENANADLNFVAHDPSPDFDDLLSWISAAVLKARLVSSGRLP